MFSLRYRAPGWLPGGHLQTIWAARLATRYQGGVPPLRRVRWTTPDADFIDVDTLEHTGQVASATNATLLVLFHGLEGHSGSHYAQAFADVARRRGWHMAVPHFRGCSGQINLRPRAYHSGDHEEVGWILRRLRERTPGRMLVVGISLGGNALLRWTQEMGSQATTVASAVAAVCAPLDLSICGQALGQGFNRQVYTRMFLHTMKPRALAKLAQYPGLFDRQRLMAARTLFEFDDVFTAPLHGFRDAHDYWTRASARPHLHRIELPTLILNPLNDPFVPAACLPGPEQCSPHVTLAQPKEGGHVGFPAGPFPAQVHSVPEQVAHWLDQHG